ncbi:TraB/GumN family protein [Flavobacteriaceae bacterium M23B6Z8]
MFRRFYVILFLSSFALNAQNSNSLLWEISGNGLESPSYIYGTMHVSKKIAFRLDDVFYEALNNSEYVALESDPALWLDHYKKYENYEGFNAEHAYNGFYRKVFKIEPPRREVVSSMLAFDSSILNNILYRTNVTSQNFEEETYLDMFIYQTAKKTAKKFIALEDIEQMSELSNRAQQNIFKKVPDAWLQKKLEKQNYYNLLQNAYRERKVAFIDSLNRGLYTDHYMKYMLYDRNAIMADGIVEIAKKGKLFAGVGAAHLPGEKGVLQLLRDKGYKVTPLISNKTSKASAYKKNFEEKVLITPHTRQTVSDSLFSIKVPDKLHKMGSAKGLSIYACPELTNGSFFTITRISRFDVFRKQPPITLATIDDMLYESIPGSIIAKTAISNQPFEGFDIINQLKNGDYQRYQIYLTPLEVIIMKLGGKRDYATKYGHLIFDSLEFRKTNGVWIKAESGFKDFSVMLPDNYIFYNTDKTGKRMLQAVDTNTGDYFFLQRANLYQTDYVEEDLFELKQIQKRFFESQQLKNGTFTVLAKDGSSEVRSSAALKENSSHRLFLSSRLKAGDYYLLGATTKNEEAALKFFNSLQIENPAYREPFRMVQDTALFFSVKTNVPPPIQTENDGAAYYADKKKKKDYEAYTKTRIYKNGNDEHITVQLEKLHDFQMYENLDSLWAKRQKKYEGNDLYTGEYKYYKDEEGHSIADFYLTDTLSHREVFIRNILRNGSIYSISSLQDSLYKPTEFTSYFYESFQPKDTVIGKSPFEDKTALFFKYLRANDSIVFSSYKKLVFNEKHMDSLEKYITRFEFPEDKIQIRNHFISAYAKMKNKRIIPFLKELYENSYANSDVQLKVLVAIAEGKNKDASTEVLSLLSKDVPVGVNTYALFKHYHDSLPLAKDLFPSIMDYASIREYKGAVYNLLSELKERKLVGVKVYERYLNQLLNEAKIALKRQLAQDNKAVNEYNYYDDDFESAQQPSLKDYITLLYPFRKEKNIKQFFERFGLVKDKFIRIHYLKTQLTNGTKANKNELLELASDIDARAYLYNELKNIKKEALIPEAYRSQDSLAVSLLYKNVSYEPNRYKHKFIKKQSISLKGKDYWGYIFKIKDEGGYDSEWKLSLIAVIQKNKPLGEVAYVTERDFSATKTLEEQISLLIEEMQLKDRPRASVNNEESDFFMGGY